MKVEMRWPYLPYARFFTRRHIDTHVNVAWIFLPARNCCFTYSTYSRGSRRCITVECRVIRSYNVDVGRGGGPVRYVAIVQLDKSRVKFVYYGGMQGIPDHLLRCSIHGYLWLDICREVIGSVVPEQILARSRDDRIRGRRIVGGRLRLNKWSCSGGHPQLSIPSNRGRPSWQKDQIGRSLARGKFLAQVRS